MSASGSLWMSECERTVEDFCANRLTWDEAAKTLQGLGLDPLEIHEMLSEAQS